MTGGVTICVLAYGETPALVRRCLASLRDAARHPVVAGIRIGLNEAGPETVATVEAEATALSASLTGRRLPPCLLYRSPQGNVGKYPMMRRMIHGDPPIVSDKILWLDDDSYVEDWDVVATYVRGYFRGVVGRKYSMLITAPAADRISGMPWYKGKFALGRATFATGGGWMAPVEFLREFDYPFPDLYHNGGDVILGILASNRGHGVRSMEGVVVNAAAGSRVCSSAPRRGLSTRPYWQPQPAAAPVPVPEFDVKELP